MERWERRNERRLPKGFVQANRRYSSRAIEHGATAETIEPREDPTENLHRKEWETPRPDAPVEDALSGELSVEATEKTEAAISYNAGKELRRILTASSENKRSRKSLGTADALWSLYEKSPPRDRESISLKIQLLEYLSDIHNDTIETHCLELYHSIPIINRDLTVYKAALPAFIRSGLYGLAEQGHVEALDQLEDGHELSGWLGKVAIGNEMWDFASRLKQQLDAKQGLDATKEVVDKKFWQPINEIPDLLSKAINLSKHYRMLNQADLLTPAFADFSGSMFKVAIVQNFSADRPISKRRQPRAEKTLNDGRIRYLIGRIQLTHANPPGFLRDVIVALTHSDAQIFYPDAHKTVSYMYRQHQSMRHAYLYQNLFFGIMTRVVKYTTTYTRRQQQSWCITPSSLEQDWVATHGQLPLQMHRWLIGHYATSGNVEGVQYSYERLLEEWPSYDDQKDLLWMLVYVHARRGDAKAAVSAFETVQKLATAAGQPSLDLRTWNVLLHAHARADDLDGGLEVMKDLVAAGHKPDVYSFNPLLELYAKRGDVESIDDLLVQYDQLSGVVRTTDLYASLMVAHNTAHDIDLARKVLEDLIPKVRSGEVTGSLTRCFNTLLTGLALHREADETMQVYRWMQDEEVAVDNRTYAAVMQALTAHRQTDDAWNIIKSVMPKEGIQPQAFHFAIVMTGYVRQGAFQKALSVYQMMLDNNIRPSLTARAIYLKARAQEEVKHRPQAGSNQTSFLSGSIVDDLEDALRDPSAGLALREPQTYSVLEDHSPQALLIYQLISVYGPAQLVDAVRTLVRRYGQEQKRQGNDLIEPLPLRLLSIVMPTYIQTEHWEEVGICWELAKEQADAIAISRPTPELEQERQTPPAPEILKLRVDESTNQTSTSRARYKPADASKPAPGLRHILSQPLRHHLKALAMQSRYSEIITTVSSTLSRGYVLDNDTWNILIETLLRPSPPLALLAFRLTEKYLVPFFPGWVATHETRSNPSARQQGLQYMRARYLAPDELMPRYRTLVKLAAALLEIRHGEALGTLKKTEENQHLHRYIGTVKQIRQHAPRTLYAIQTMPAVPDSLQTILLRRETMN